MEQAEILALLVEAKNITLYGLKEENQKLRRGEILRLLCSAAQEGFPPESDTATERRNLVQRLFYDALDFRPALLPSTLPTFALLCSRQRGELYAEINWNLVP